MLAATSALIHVFGGDWSYRTEAESRADEAVARYQAAIHFIEQAIDQKRGGMRGRRLGGQSFSLPQLIDREQEERTQLGPLFPWPARGANAADSRRGTNRVSAPRAGTHAPQK